MKHLIIFLNYYQSRLDNPVYRLFTTESVYRRNATLLFLPKALDERELVHEVSELRYKQKESSDVCFHICANLERPQEGATVISTVCLIRKVFQPDAANKYSTFVYGYMPLLSERDALVRKSIWNNLATINNGVSDYHGCQLLNRVFLYSDKSQKSLAELLFCVSRNQNLGFSSIQSSSSSEFPPIFGSFNSKGISYPEEDVRSYLHQYYLYSILRYSLPDVNPISVETCNSEAQKILSSVPIQTSKICLQDETFINLKNEENSKWQSTESFWEENIELQIHGLSDTPREDWLVKIRQRAETLFQGRYRDLGVEYFYKIESKKTSEYCNVLLNIIRQEFEQSILSQTFTPEAQKMIIRGIVNILQQKVLELQKLRDESDAEVKNIDHQMTEIKSRWNSLNIFNRLMGKDSAVLDSYRSALTKYMVARTFVPGCDFAIKLLNELIPEVSAMLDKAEALQKVLTEALSAMKQMCSEYDPSKLFGIFGSNDLEQCKVAIASDTKKMLAEYQHIMNIVHDSGLIHVGEELISSVRSYIGESADTYLKQRIEECSIPAVIGVPVEERIAQKYADKGGISAFIDELKTQIPINLAIKGDCKPEEKYTVVSDQSSFELLHTEDGITLQDLDGFSGQRMFIEPSIF